MPIILDFSIASWLFLRGHRHMSQAIIKTGGKQYLVEENKTVRVPLMKEEVGTAIKLDALLTLAEGAQVGRPVVAAVRVSATVVDHGRAPKIVIFKKKRRKHYKRKHGHRQDYTTLRIDSIG
jgi:large subunit ribosomal protein L21